MDYEAIAKGMSAAVPFIRHLNLEITRIEPGASTVVLPDRPELSNHVGIQHAGALFSVAEAASGAAFVGAFAERMGDIVPLAASAEINYEKLAQGPIEANAELGIDQAQALATLDSAGRVEFPCEIVLSDSAGKQVATATVGWHVRLKERTS